MSVVTTLNDIKGNLWRLEAYLASTDPKEREFAQELVRLGRCFVVTSGPNGFLFAPSRFIGYRNNSRSVHLAYIARGGRDGKKTTPIISKLLQQEPIQSTALEREYRRFCKRIGIAYRDLAGTSIRRKYWPLQKTLHPSVRP